MNNREDTIRRYIKILALGVSLVALPFSVQFTHAGIILFILTSATENNWREKLAIVKQSFLLQILLGFFMVQLIGLIYSENISYGLFVVEKKIFLFLLPVAMATSSVALKEKEIRVLGYGFVAACFAGTVLCLVHSFTTGSSTALEDFGGSSAFYTLNPSASEMWLTLSYTELGKGIGIHPAYLSAYLLFCILFLFYYARRFNALSWCFVFYFSFFIVALSSRITTLSLFIIFGFIIFQSLKQQNKTVAFSLAFLSILCLSLLFYNPVSRYRHMQEIATRSFNIETHHVYHTSIETRLSLWWLAIQSLREINPVSGAGTGDVLALMKQSGADHQITNTLNTYDTHNQFLYTLLAHGVVGLIFLCALLFIPFYMAWTHQDHLIVGFLFVFIMLCITESAFELQKGIAFFALFFPLLVFQGRSYHRSSVLQRPPIHAGN
ncbi:MAG: O-antigen ligase family protein [Bacteroidota bacterium]